jgi:hypothetical protein
MMPRCSQQEERMGFFNEIALADEDVALEEISSQGL